MKAFTASLLTALAAATPDVAWESLGHFKLHHAAFPHVTKFEDSDPFLLCSAFSAIGNGDIYIVDDIAAAVQSGSVKNLASHNLYIKHLQWPNDVKVVPYDVFDQRAIVIPDGFLVPGHSDGGIYVSTIADDDIRKVENTYTIAHNKDGYFYHMGEWIDLNGDGRKDFITAKSNAKEGGGRLVWYEHPEEGLEGEWIEHVVTAGPDVGIEVVEGIWKNEIVVFAAEFFNERVSFYRVSTKDGTLVDSRIIEDGTILSAYSVTYADINGNGDMELMVNNHEKSDKTNGIWAYTFPSKWMTGDFEKHTLATGFKNAFSITVPNMAPGFPYPFYPEVNHSKHTPPHIVVAGDGDHTAHIMTLTDQKTYSFDLDTIKDEKGTVGALTWADLDNDGWNELWVPNYDGGYVEVFKFMPLESHGMDSTMFQ